MENTATNYNFKEIEDKWKDKWFSNNLYQAVDFSPKPKKYILAEFPYPSGAALHAGHAMRYTVPDVYARFLRMNGYNVLFPMGWDAFGLPAENYAIKTGIHPAETTKKAIGIMKESLTSMGYSIDWSREISTIDPEYYKWTQWLFLKFYEHNLAELREMPVWWCEKLKTVLSDEEVLTTKDGNKISERGEHHVEKRNLKQWILKIPEYAEKLIEGLNEVDFPDAIKHAQINWIGKSVGAEIDFEIENTGKRITVYTTRLDTIYGATFIVISPEHPLAIEIAHDNQKQTVTAYVSQAQSKSELERNQTIKEKTGIFTGSYAINPFNKQRLPIWVGDFVVASYGTGAIMGVPAHDERDMEFAKKYNLEIKQVIQNDHLIESDQYTGLSIEEAQSKMLDQIISDKLGKSKTNFKIRDWIFSRQRYWGEPIPLKYIEPDGHIEEETNLPLLLPEVPDYEPTSDGISPLAKNKQWVNTTSSDGKPAKRETNTMPNWAGSCWYFIRYVDPHNPNEFASPEKMKYWLPVDRYFGGAEHTTMHLLYSRFWYKFFYDIGLVPSKEPYTWRLNGGILLGPDGRKMSKSLGNVVDPMTVVNGYGADATRMFICFIGPYQDTYPWNENGIKATYRLLNTIYIMRKLVSNTAVDIATKKHLSRLIKNVTDMYTNLKINTAVSEIMIFVNHLKTAKSINTEVWKDFIKVIAPLAPFIAEELWQEINAYPEWTKENSVHVQAWPKFDEKLATETVTQIPVQINGKVREQIEISENETENSIKEKVLSNAKVKTYTDGKEIKNFLYIPNKIVSISLA